MSKQREQSSILLCIRVETGAFVKSTNDYYPRWEKDLSILCSYSNEFKKSL